MMRQRFAPWGFALSGLLAFGCSSSENPKPSLVPPQTIEMDNETLEKFAEEVQEYVQLRRSVLTHIKPAAPSNAAGRVGCRPFRGGSGPSRAAIPPHSAPKAVNARTDPLPASAAQMRRSSSIAMPRTSRRRPGTAGIENPGPIRRPPRSWGARRATLSDRQIQTTP